MSVGERASALSCLRAVAQELCGRGVRPSAYTRELVRMLVTRRAQSAPGRFPCHDVGAGARASRRELFPALAKPALHENGRREPCHLTCRRLHAQVWGSSQQIADEIVRLRNAGVNHVLLNPVFDEEAQMEKDVPSSCVRWIAITQALRDSGRANESSCPSGSFM